MICSPEESSATYATLPTMPTPIAHPGVSYAPRTVGVH
jgi:hypothetical protein